MPPTKRPFRNKQDEYKLPKKKQLRKLDVKNAITQIIDITAGAPFCSKIPADGNNRDKRRKPNPLRLAGRVFNFQDHQYVPRNTPPRVLQSLWLAKSPLFLSALSFSLTRNASWIDIVLSFSFSLPLVLFGPRLSSAPIGRWRPSYRGGCCVHLSFYQTPSASRIHRRNK